MCIRDRCPPAQPPPSHPGPPPTEPRRSPRVGPARWLGSCAFYSLKASVLRSKRWQRLEQWMKSPTLPAMLQVLSIDAGLRSEQCARPAERRLGGYLGDVPGGHVVAVSVGGPVVGG